MTASPPFARSKRWAIDRIAAGATVSLRDIDLDVDADYLNRLDEAERGVLRFRIEVQGKVLAEHAAEVRILARDEWGGMASMGELLPAFVTPNDPALASLLKSAASVLEQSGLSAALDGYQSGDPKRAWLLTASLWSAVAARKLTYANPPSSFERDGQKTRRVETVFTDGLATCLDTTLLFASALEAVGLHSVLVMCNGHCFVGVWMIETRTLKKLIETDGSEIRKAIAARELVVFETTLVTNRPAPDFSRATQSAESRLSESRESEFVAAIDVARARMAQVRPLATHGVRPDQVPHDDTDSLALPLPEAPGFDQLPVDEAEERPTTAAGRIERWQRKLLDLSLRNRLLNFRDSKQSITVLCPDVSRLEDMLADGGRLRFVSLNEENRVADRDANLHHERTQQDLDVEFARRALERNEIACPIEVRDLEARLTALFRKGKSDLEEGGSNTIYLAVGFLRWRPVSTEPKTCRAPLLLVPVTLVRRSASSPFYLTSHDDEVRFNSTLLQLLKKDFDCDLTALETNLPMDDSGVDVLHLLDRTRRAVRDIPGFEVVEEAAIASFSFAKYLMWKDLVDRVEQLGHNRVVRHLVNDPDKPFVSSAPGRMPKAHDIDVHYKPADIVHPLPADSSQLAAVMAASEGHDMVIIGPPGTGKSQTIANLIAQCLSIGKSVLFVAEKTAALDVVHRRLREHGLEDCCVELHSNKAERRRFLIQMDASWKRRARPGQQTWLDVTERLRIRRDELNAYVAAIHIEHPNGWTAFKAMGLCVHDRDIQSPALAWPRSTRHNRDQYAALTSAVADLALAFGAVPRNGCLEQIQASEWSMAWETDLLTSCRDLQEASECFEPALKRLAGLLGIPSLTDLAARQLTGLYSLAQELIQHDPPPESLLLREDVEALRSSLSERRNLLTKRDQARAALQKAMATFSAMVDVAGSCQADEQRRQTLFRFAAELVRPSLPPAALVFHPRFDTLSAELTVRDKMVKARDEALSAVESRSFNRIFLVHMPIDKLLTDWRTASAAFWPLSLWKLSIVRKKLKSFMSSGSMPDLDLDLTLLQAYRDSCRQLSDHLKALGLPLDLEAAVAESPFAINEQLEWANQLREAIRATGSSPERVAAVVGPSFDKLVPAARALYPPGKELESLRNVLQDNLKSLALERELSTAVEEDAGALDEQLQAAVRLRAAVKAAELPNDSTNSVLQAITAASHDVRRSAAAEYCTHARRFQDAWKGFVNHAGNTPAARGSMQVVSDARSQAATLLDNRTLLKPWTMWLNACRRAAALELSDFVAALEAGKITAVDAARRFELSYARWWLPIVVDSSNPLRTFQRHSHEEAIEAFRRLDELARKAAVPRVLSAIYHDLPPSEDVPRKSELGTLRHQMSLKRPSRSIRDMISSMPESFGKLAPCLLMSPLSIAQYLPAGQAPFDVVVFDEASQIPTWDAIGAIARGKQTIIVGDPKQLPPTNFFGRIEGDEDNADIEDHDKDLESILDEAQASGLPTVQLNWHYRSRHESLIAFSNHNYYGNQLVTFPSAESVDRGVSLTIVQDAIFDRGKSVTNRREAEAIVADAVQRMKRCLRRPEAERLTYGVVTFNSQQQSLIQDLFDDALRRSPELEWFFADERIEETTVKNLENVQGDERDVMYFSITFGKDSAGKFPLNFGALNRMGGERRLNVAITRARQSLRVYSSFLPDQLRAERSTTRGVHDLKAFLDFAHRGSVAIASRTDGSAGDHESAFEQTVADSLIQRGWAVDPQVGVSGFRIDLGVIHPDRPGAYLAGVECDGATYHRSAAARDRDKTRQQVLEGLGWNIVRVWSPDWWYDSKSALNAVHDRLSQLLAESQAAVSNALDASEPIETSAATPPADDQATIIESGITTQPPASRELFDVDIDNTGAPRPQLITTRDALSRPRPVYVRAQLPDAIALQSRFEDASYAAEIRRMALQVVEVEGPVRDDVVVRRVARAHGFARAGSKVRERVLAQISEVTLSQEGDRRFLWREQRPPDRVPFRYAAAVGERRCLDEIAMEELMSLVESRPEFLKCDDPAIELAREIGLARLSKSARERLENAIEQVGRD